MEAGDLFKVEVFSRDGTNLPIIFLFLGEQLLKFLKELLREHAVDGNEVWPVEEPVWPTRDVKVEIQESILISDLSDNMIQICISLF